MFTKKTTKRKPPKRVTKRRNRQLLYLIVFTVTLSSLSALTSYLLIKQPVIISPLAGAVLSASDDSSKTILQELAKQNIHPIGIVEQSDQITIKLSSTEEVLIVPNKDIASQLSSLQLILRQLTMEGKHFSRLDLRFDKPVITF